MNDETGREKEVDGSAGLQYLRNRYYDMETGRFISRDPLSAMPDWVEHPYMYASANPVNLVDPLGLCSFNPRDWLDCVSSAGGAIGGVVRSIGGGALQLVQLAGEYVINVGSNIRDWLSDNRDVVMAVTGAVLSAAMFACIASGGGAGVGLAACVGVAVAWGAFHTWAMHDAVNEPDEDIRHFKILIRTINAIPGVGVATTVINALLSALEPSPAQAPAE